MERIVLELAKVVSEDCITDVNKLASSLTLEELWRSPQSEDDYKWTSYKWLDEVVSVNVMTIDERVDRIEVIVIREGPTHISHADLERWKAAIRQTFGEPQFCGDWKDAGFPDDEEGLFACEWLHDDSACIVLLHRKDDAETPGEIVIVLKPQVKQDQ